MQQDQPSPKSAHRIVSLDFIAASGGYAVRVVRGQKRPHKGWDPRHNDEKRSELLLRELRADQTDNVGVHLHDLLVDVDIDNDDPALKSALDLLLPPSNHVWGHASRLRTHRAYQLRLAFFPDQYPILARIKRLIGIELRGGPPERGEYSLLPGSTHPSDEEYLWSDLKKARVSTAVVHINVLLKAMRLAGAVYILAPFWTEGLRNDLVMALSGFLHRTSRIADELGGEDTVFRVDKDLALRFLKCLLKVTGDDEADLYSRMKTFEATWSKAEKGAPVTGASRIGQITGDKTIMAKLYTLLTDSPEIAAVDEFTDRFAIWRGPGIIIDMEKAETPFMSRRQFCDSFGDQAITTAKDKRRLIADLIFSLPTTLRLAGVTFEPGSPKLVPTREGDKVNRWRGFAVEPHSDLVEAQEISPFLTYLHDVVANKSEVVHAWVLGWIAHIFKEPANKTGTALVLVGPPGIGKTFLGEHFIVPIIGAHAVATNAIDRAVQGFNAVFEDRIFVQCDEAISNRQRLLAAKLKSFITDKTITIERKGVNPYVEPNHMRLLFTSNETQDAVFLSDGMMDRRYAVLRVSDEQMQKTDYWTPLVEWAKDKANLGKVHRYLLDHVYDRRLIEQPPMTKAKIAMQQHSMRVEDRWLAEMVSRSHPLSEAAHKAWWDAPYEKSQEIDRQKWPKFVSLSALTLDYSLFIRTDPVKTVPLNEQQVRTLFVEKGLHIKLEKRLKTREYDNKLQQFILRRVRLYELASRQAIMDHLLLRYGSEYEEDDGKTEEDHRDEKTEF